MELATEPTAADWRFTREQVDDRTLEGQRRELEVPEAVLPFHSTNFSRLTAKDMDLGPSEWNTLNSKIFGSPQWDSEETEPSDSTETSSTWGLASWTTSSSQVGEELGVCRLARNSKRDTDTGYSKDSLAAQANTGVQESAPPASGRAAAVSFREAVAARRRAARRRLLGADGLFIGEHAGGFCASDCIKCNPRKYAERPSE